MIAVEILNPDDDAEPGAAVVSENRRRGANSATATGGRS
jgi:hypothetical protein